MAPAGTARRDDPADVDLTQQQGPMFASAQTAADERPKVPTRPIRYHKKARTRHAAARENMNHRQRTSILRNLFFCSLAAALVASCGGDNLDPVLGTPGEVVTLPTPVVPVVPVVPEVPVADTTRP